jgi:ABC-type branched-subunit amino acid transport system ATPase component
MAASSSTAIDLAGRPAALIARKGVGYVPQGRALFAGMSVRAQPGARPAEAPARGGVAWSDDKILAFFPRLKPRLDTPADYLSGGEQQMVAVARALPATCACCCWTSRSKGSPISRRGAVRGVRQAAG